MILPRPTFKYKSVRSKSSLNVFSSSILHLLYDSMRVTDNSVTYGIRQSRIVDNVMPRIDRELTADDRGPHVVPVFHDLKEVPFFLIGKRIYPPVVDDEELYSLELLLPQNLLLKTGVEKEDAC